MGATPTYVETQKRTLGADIEFKIDQHLMDLVNPQSKDEIVKLMTNSPKILEIAKSVLEQQSNGISLCFAQNIQVLEQRQWLEVFVPVLNAHLRRESKGLVIGAFGYKRANFQNVSTQVFWPPATLAYVSQAAETTEVVARQLQESGVFEMFFDPQNLSAETLEAQLASPELKHALEQLLNQNIYVITKANPVQCCSVSVAVFTQANVEEALKSIHPLSALFVPELIFAQNNSFFKQSSGKQVHDSLSIPAEIFVNEPCARFLCLSVMADCGFCADYRTTLLEGPFLRQLQFSEPKNATKALEKVQKFIGSVAAVLNDSLKEQFKQFYGQPETEAVPALLVSSKPEPPPALDVSQCGRLIFEEYKTSFVKKPNARPQASKLKQQAADAKPSYVDSFEAHKIETPVPKIVAEIVEECLLGSGQQQTIPLAQFDSKVIGKYISEIMESVQKQLPTTDSVTMGYDVENKPFMLLHRKNADQPRGEMSRQRDALKAL